MNGSPVICDFGLASCAEVVNEPKSLSVARAGNARWMAPELQFEVNAISNERSDIWAFGMFGIEVRHQLFEDIKWIDSYYILLFRSWRDSFRSPNFLPVPWSSYQLHRASFLHAPCTLNALMCFGTQSNDAGKRIQRRESVRANFSLLWTHKLDGLLSCDVDSCLRAVLLLRRNPDIYTSKWH